MELMVLHPVDMLYFNFIIAQGHAFLKSIECVLIDTGI